MKTRDQQYRDAWVLKENIKKPLYERIKLNEHA